MTKVYDNATDLITFARLQAQNTTSGSSYLGSDGLLKFAAEDEPRIEYAADGSLKGLLIEEQRTNLITESTPQSGDLVTSGGSFSYVTCNFTPLSGPGIHFDTSGVSSYTYFAPTYTAADYTLSVFVEMDDGNAPAFGFFNDVSNDFSLVADGLKNPTTVPYAIEHFGGNTYRVSVTFASASTTAQNTGVIKYNTNSSRTFKVTGFQLEEGSFATSYIPTSGSTVTRSPDIASIPVSAFGYNQTAGTVVVEAKSPRDDNGNRLAILVEAGTALNRVVDLYRQPTGVRMYDGTTAIDASPPSDPATGLKVAGAYSAGDYAVVADGGSPGTSTTASVNTPDTLYMGANGLSQKQLNGHIKSLQYYPRRLTDAQLQELTA